MPPTIIFNQINIVGGKNAFAKLPKTAIMLKNSKVDITAPIPNKYISFFFIVPSEIFAENTPAQNIIVRGLDKVKKIVFKNILSPQNSTFV